MKVAKFTYKFFLCSLTVGLVMSSLPASGQDKHFSQFYRTPMLINPGMTGVFNGDIRAIINHRDQWRSVGLYRTSGLSYDMGLFKGKWRKGYLGAGLVVFRDQVGDFNLATTSAAISRIRTTRPSARMVAPATPRTVPI